MCRRVQEDGFKSVNCPGIDEVERCPEDRVFKLSEENQEFWQVFSRIMPGLFQRSGFNYEAIKWIFGLYRLPDEIQRLFLEKILIVIAVVQEFRQKANPNG